MSFNVTYIDHYSPLLAHICGIKMFYWFLLAESYTLPNMFNNTQTNMKTILIDKLSHGEKEGLGLLLSSKKKTVLGSGATAKVYPFHMDKVVRVQKYCGEYSEALESYLEWIRLCTSTKSKHLPRIHYCHVEYCKSGKQWRKGCLKTIVVVMERLKEWHSHTGTYSFQDEWVSDLEDACRGYGVSRNLFKMITKYKMGTRDSIKRVTSKMCSIRVNDIHSGNVMCRRDGTLVITDPVV